MKVIVNADDFGYDDDTVAATVECFSRRLITSATIMPGMPATEAAVAFARNHPEISFGVHLTYTTQTVERPVCEPSEIRSLTRSDGAFLSPNSMRTASLFGHVRVDDVILETTAQLGLIRDHNVRISHVDSHGHLHKFPQFREALRSVLPKFGIRRVRSVQTLYLDFPWRRPTYWLGLRWREKLRREFTTTDSMFMPVGGVNDDWQTKLVALAPSEGALEVGIHPGRSEPWRSQQALAAEEFASTCRESKVELISWHDIQ